MIDTILDGDCRKVLRTIPDATIACCVTSPPYWGLRNYGVKEQLGQERTPEAYTEDLVSILREVRRTLRKDGTLWLNLGDCFATGAGSVGNHPGGGEQGEHWKGNLSSHRPSSTASRGSRFQRLANGHGKRTGRKAMGPIIQPNRLRVPGLKPKDLVGIPWRVAFALQADGWWLRSDIIWDKTNPTPESVKDRPTRAHEFIFLLSKSRKYYYDYKAVREPCVSSPSNMKRMRDGRARLSRKSLNDKGALNSANVRTQVAQKGGVGHVDGRNRRSVWRVSAANFKGAHFATFPPKLIEPCILAGSRLGDTVLDPFVGAGTTCMVAAQFGRKYIGIELNPEYAAMARVRLKSIQRRFV